MQRLLGKPVQYTRRPGLAAAIMLLVCGTILLLTQPTGAGARLNERDLGVGGTPTPTPTCVLNWRLEHGPNAGSLSNALSGVTALSPTEFWSVGSARDTGGYNLPVAQRWDGTQWNVTATAPVTESGHLAAVDGVSGNDVWAVGHSTSGMGTQTLIMHWDGSTWLLVPSPNRSRYQYNDRLTGVTAISANDVWAVGFYRSSVSGSPMHTLIMHWDGVSWQVVTSPNGATFRSNYLTSISATSGNDIWAVGYFASTSPPEYRPLLMRWNGTSWSLSSVTLTSGYDYFIDAVSARAPDDVWAVGSYYTVDYYRTFVIRWNGVSWQRVSAPNPNSTAELFGVAAVSPTEVWAVGITGTARQTLAMRWNGTGWQVFPSPNASQGDNRLNDVAASSEGNMWAVGNYTSGGAIYNLTMEYPGDDCAFPTSTPPLTVTSTPTTWVLPSRTPTLTQTPTCGLDWHVVGSPNSNYSDYLRRVAVISPDDVWAVGTHKQHWDGTSWSVVPGGGANGISGTASNDVWAVGTEENNGYRTKIEHWDGTQWTRVPSPNPGDFYNFLTDVVALSPDDVWAVGYYGHNYQTLTLHWDGVQWRQVPSPSYGSSNDSNRLEAVFALSPFDIWAVGYYWNSQAARYQVLALRWDGDEWSLSLGLPPEADSKQLLAVGGTGPNDIWAVGTTIYHWNGTQWTEIANPIGANLFGVVAFAPNNAWATGTLRGPEYYLNETAVLHWDGAQWTRMPSPNPDPNSSGLFGAAAVGPNDIWAVGYTGLIQPGDHRTMTMRYHDPCLTSTPTVTGTPPTQTATFTPTPGSPTRTPTPTYTPTFTVTPTATLPCGLAWHRVTSPNPTTGNALNDVAVISSTDIWAVGWQRPNSYEHRSLTMHWDGNTWSVIPSPNFGEYTVLTSITAISSNDVWAVGYTGSVEGYTLALHWDGTAWTRVATPNPDTQSNTLLGVTATSSNNVWAVGHYGTTNDRTLAMRWNGSGWSIVPTVNPHPNDNQLVSVAAINGNPNDIWAVGRIQNGSTLIEHWDGTQWSVVPSPNPYGDNVLNKVAGAATNDIWAVGYGSQPAGLLMLHWDGAQWSPVQAPYQGRLYGLEVISANDVWAVGDTGQFGSEQTLTLHWDGTAWTRVPSPNVGVYPNVLGALAAVSPTDVWAVGSFSTAGYNTPPQNMVMRYHDPCFTSTPTPTDTPVGTNTVTAIATTTQPPTQTPGGPSATPVPSNTPVHTFTPEPCFVQFEDVQLGSTFYEFVRCLACRGIISGYSDATFRPNSQVTRGQLAKIVSNAAGFAEPPTQQTFQDVLPSNTFYEWIERLTSRGYMSGYVCGGPGEPCNTGRPYFRPFANATRGQTSKIVANAAGYIETPTEQTFEDVPSTHTFYTEIQRLASRNIMGGYTCGGPSEPCLSGKPYFRPSNNVTRGQSSKIVANTFFPNCNP